MKNIFIYDRKYFIALLISLILAGCGVGDSTVDLGDKDCTINGQNKTLYKVMNDAYLWYENVPDLNYSSYGELKTLLEDLKYKELDKWSYIIDKETYENYYSGGTYYGFGFSFLKKSGKIYLRLVYKGSPAYEGGLRRGDELLEINGKTIDEIESHNLWKSIFGENKKGIEGTFKFGKNGTVQTITIAKDEVTAYSILHNSILNMDGKKIGYFVFNKFIEPSKQALKAQFREFKNANIDELILDLRYNGGGRIHIAQYLSSLIVGDSAAGEVVASLKYNDRYTKWNQNYYFNNEANSLNLSKVYMIATRSSCSASELVMNALKPHMYVQIVGERTCGKPVGMRGYNFCGNHLAPIQFGVVNSEGEGEYFGGIEPKCFVGDDVEHDFGDSNEKMLKETLYLIKNGECTVEPAAKRAKVKSAIRENPNVLSGWQQEIGAI